MLKKTKNIFILGIKGVAMANLALILTKMGKKVYGWDVTEDFITKPLLDSLPIKIFNHNHLDKEVIKKTDLIIYSAAHQGDKNPLLNKFNPQIPRLHQVDVIDNILKQFSLPIAVAGSHGKTTTSSLLAFSLINLQQKPSYIVGSSNFNNSLGANYYPPSRTSYFIVEADEYGLNPPYNKTPKFYHLHPKLIIATNIDFDHPDVYQNLDAVKIAFLNFFNKKTIIACGDNKNLKDVLKKFERKQYLLYGFNQDNDYQIINWVVDEKNSQFDLYYKNKKIDRFKVKIFGTMNISNTSAVIVCLKFLGFSLKDIKAAIENFTGAKRRFEEIYHHKNTYLFDDYAHHPTEIIKTITTARLRFPKRRIIVIFQPHTYSRTKILLKEFAASLSNADLSLVLPIFPSAREKTIQEKISSLKIVNLNKEKLIYISKKQELINKLKKILKVGDIIFTMGAGDVYQLKNIIIPIINSIK